VIHLWQLQIENPINWQKKLKFGFRQSECLTGFERLENILNLFLFKIKSLLRFNCHSSHQTQVIHLWQLQIEKPNWQKIKFGFRQSERLTGVLNVWESILNLFLVQNKVLAKI
jgi:hypothetical protein